MNSGVTANNKVQSMTFYSSVYLSWIEEKYSELGYFILYI